MSSLVRQDPFRTLFSFPRWEDFDDSTQRGFKVYETEDNIIAEAVVAGVAAKDVEIHIEDGVITIKAEKAEEEKNQLSSYKYYYTAALAGGQWDKADAEVEHGIVKVIIPKQPAARPQKITVKEKKEK